MPRKVTRKTMRRPMRKYKPRYKKRTTRRMPLTRTGIATQSRGIQKLNTYRMKPHYFEDVYASPPSIGAGAAIPLIATFNLAQIDRYSTLRTMFRQYKISWIKIRITMRQIENTDSTIIPELMIRYNYDPNLTLAQVTESSLNRYQNLVVKRFLQGDSAGGSELQYTIKPAVMGAAKLYQIATYTPRPLFNQWLDFSADSPAVEVEHYGLVLLWKNLPTGVNIDYRFQVGYSVRDVI